MKIAKRILVWMNSSTEVIYACAECMHQVGDLDNHCAHCGRKLVKN